MKPTIEEIEQSAKAYSESTSTSEQNEMGKYSGYIKGFNDAISLQPECDKRFNSLMETVNMIAELYRHHEKSNAERGLYKEAIEAKAKAEALEQLMGEASRISSMLKPQPPTK